MAQAMHGGRLSEAVINFGLPRHLLVDFSSNLNGWAPKISPELWSQWQTRVSCYPAADAESIRGSLSRLYEVPEDWILPVAGAIEALYLAARIFPNRRVGVIEPGFSDYARAFVAAGVEPERIVLSQEQWHAPISQWGVDWESFEVVVLGNPNNPTAGFQSRQAMEPILERLEAAGTWLVVDEAFIEFVRAQDEQTLLPLLARYPRCLILRSLTKSWCIPGLRLGFLATANPEAMSQLRAMQAPWTINGVAEGWAETFLNREYFQKLLGGMERMEAERAWMVEALEQIEGLRVFPSEANYLLLELQDLRLEGSEIYHRLGAEGLLVRVCDSFYGMPVGRYLRVAVKSREENARLSESLYRCCQTLRGAGR